MRAEHLSDNVNVHLHATRAAERVKTNGRMPQMLDTSQPFANHGDSVWKRFKERWFKWEYNLTVAGRTIEKGWVVPQPLGIALILVMISGTSVLYWRIIDSQASQDREVTEKLQAQRDLLIEVKTTLAIKAEADREKQRKNEEDDQLQDMQIQDLKDKLSVLNSK